MLFVILSKAKSLFFAVFAVLHLDAFNFSHFYIVLFFLVCSPVRWALPFVGCDKRKQKHAFVIRFARSQITAVPLLFIFLRVLFLLTVVVAFTFYFIGNLSVATISFFTAHQRTTQIQFMFSLLVRLRFNFRYVFYLALVFLPVYSDLPT